MSPALNDGEKVDSEDNDTPSERPRPNRRNRRPRREVKWVNPDIPKMAGFSMGGSGSVYLSIMHPKLFCAAGSMGGGLRGRGEQMAEAIGKAIPVWKENDFGFFLVNGDNDRPDAFKTFSGTLKENEIDHKVVILPDTKHNLGLYYKRSVSKLLAFISRHLEK